MISTRIMQSVALFVFAALWLVAAETTPSHAQDATVVRIGIVDVQRVLRESRASRGMRPEMDRLRKDFQKRVREEERDLRLAAQELLKQRAILAPEVFAEKRRALDEEGRKAQRAVQVRKRGLDRAFNDTMNIIFRNVFSITQAIAKEKRLNLVIEKKFVFLAANSFDLTPEVIAQLDKKLPSVQIQLKPPPKTGKAPKGNN